MDDTPLHDYLQWLKDELFKTQKAIAALEGKPTPQKPTLGIKRGPYDKRDEFANPVMEAIVNLEYASLMEVKAYLRKIKNIEVGIPRLLMTLTKLVNKKKLAYQMTGPNNGTRVYFLKPERSKKNA